jgi:hypothetical protein
MANHGEVTLNATTELQEAGLSAPAYVLAVDSAMPAANNRETHHPGVRRPVEGKALNKLAES